MHAAIAVLYINADIDECQNSPCESNCSNTVGSFICSCPAMYTVASDGLNCVGKISSCLVKGCSYTDCHAFFG